MRCPVAPHQINEALFLEKIIGGLDLSHMIDNSMLLCVTEVNAKQDIDRMVEVLTAF